MSFDLLAFDPDRVPADDQAMQAWYDRLITWEGPAQPVPLAGTAPGLKKFYRALSQDFPPMNPVGEGASASPFGLIKRLLSGGPARDPRLSEAFDERRLTDYTFTADAIYMAFAASQSEDVLRAVLDAAIAVGVGVWAVSLSGTAPMRTPDALKLARQQMGEAPNDQLKDADLFAMLKAEGWTLHRDPVSGYRSATLLDGDKLFGVAPSMRRWRDGFRIDWAERAIPVDYLTAANIINADSSPIYPLKIEQGTFQKAPQITLADAKARLEVIVQQLRAQDLEAQVQEVAALPFATPGNAAIRMLAAKACLGEFFELCEIRDRMKAGERQGFVNYVQVEHLERAVEACIQIDKFS